MKTLNIYINGTNQPNTLDSLTSLANVLHAMTIQDENQSSLCIEGCGINNTDPRDFGAIFTFYLESQINKVIDHVKDLLQQNNDRLVLNLYGFSRGGAAVFWICKKLKGIDPALLEINVASLEPVPGNFVRAAYLDHVTGVGSTLSSRIANLSDCNNVKNMLVLFTNQPLPDIACHAPLLPIKPDSASMIVDVVPGCHANAQFYVLDDTQSLIPYSPQSAITFHYVANFLKDCSTQFNGEKFRFSSVLKLDRKDQLKSLLSSQASQLEQNSRSMHFYNEITTNPNKEYLNLMHQELVTGQKTENANACILSVKDPSPRPSYYNGQASLSSNVASVVLFSGACFAASTGNPEVAASVALTGSYVYAQRPK